MALDVEGVLGCRMHGGHGERAPSDTATEGFEWILYCAQRVAWPIARRSGAFHSMRRLSIYTWLMEMLAP
jgi:hypothetical protein